MSEPCGLSQLIAMRFGSIPVVRETGGLKDTVPPYNKYTGEGRGFTFTNINAGDMVWVLREAAALYRSNKPAWRALQKAGMTRRLLLGPLRQAIPGSLPPGHGLSPVLPHKTRSASPGGARFFLCNFRPSAPKAPAFTPLCRLTHLLKADKIFLWGQELSSPLFLKSEPVTGGTVMAEYTKASLPR